jgi:hypothetical protein
MTLLVARIGRADDVHATLAAHDLALLAHPLDACSNFHGTNRFNNENGITLMSETLIWMPDAIRVPEMDREMSTISPQFATGQAQRGPRPRKTPERGRIRQCSGIRD